MANPLGWSIDVLLIEIDDIHTDVVYSNIELNRIVLKGKQDTGAQINVLSKTVFQTLQKRNEKLPLYPKTGVKLVGYGNKTIKYLGTTKINGYGNKTIKYLGTTKIKCNHNGVERDAEFYVTDVPDTKTILRLRLCIDLGLIVVKCDDKCKCKKVQVTEASSLTLIENTERSEDQSSMLPSVYFDMKIDETNLKAHYATVPRFV